MKLHRLELTGFGPFRERQTVDFDAFDDDGLFLISGRTGTGKSSILDGVSFALYGTVPRYEGGEKRLRSDHSHLSDPTEVRLEFTVGETRWRVTRAPEYDRPAKRGGGLTTEPPRAELEELVGDVWVGRAAKPRTVGEALSEVLGLNAQQFQQVILLAQNQFSRFLLAPGDERQTLLRTLFGTRRFEQYRDDLDERRRAAQKTLDAAGEHARTLLGLAEELIAAHALGEADATTSQTGYAAADLDGRRTALVAATSRAAYRAEQAGTVRAQADEAAAAARAAHERRTAQAARAADRAAVRARLAALEERSAEIGRARATLASARAAAELRAPLDAVDRAAAAQVAAERAVTAARSEWAAAGGAPDVDPVARAEALTEDLARWQDAADTERDAARLRDRLAERSRTIDALEVELRELDARRADVPAERDAIDAPLTEARAVAARRDDIHRRRSELAARCDAAREAAALTDAAAQADREHAAANDAAAAAVAAVTALLQRRLAGYAGELSAALVPGEPCAVCGSTAHPHPAVAPDAPVTDDALAEAEHDREKAHAAASAAGSRARDVRERLADARARAGGGDESELRRLLDEATADAAAADTAASRVDDLLAQRAELDRRAEADTARHAGLADSLASARAEHVATQRELSRAEEVVANARGGFATVADRIADGAAERERARAVADAEATLAERDRAHRAAVADRDERVDGSAFDTVDEVRSALRTDAEIAELDTRVSTHAADLSATRARLLELELDTFDEPTDDELAASARALQDADAARTSAIGAERDAQNVASRLGELARAADDSVADIAELAAETAVVTRLADTVSGRAPNTMKMDLETFVLAAELEEIVAAANLRLSEMSSGRYTLHHSDARAARGRASGLGIDVLDAHTGRLRPPQSLSGGETFLASLALALGLGEVVTSRAGGIRLDTLFVDEGFGSLDPETLELAMRTLDELRAGGRAVGVISHVEAMKEQLPAQLVVEATPEGPSVIRQDAVATA